MRSIFQSVYDPTSHFTAFSNQTDRLYGPSDRKDLHGPFSSYYGSFDGLYQFMYIGHEC